MGIGNSHSECLNKFVCIKSNHFTSVRSTTETPSETVSHKSKVFFTVVRRCKRINCFVIVTDARELNFF